MHNNLRLRRSTFRKLSSRCANHAAGSKPLSFAVPSSVCIAAARFPARADPVQSPFRRPMAMGRIMFSTGLLSRGWPRAIASATLALSATLIGVWRSQSCIESNKGCAFSCRHCVRVSTSRCLPSCSMTYNAALIPGVKMLLPKFLSSSFCHASCLRKIPTLHELNREP